MAGSYRKYTNDFSEKIKYLKEHLHHEVKPLDFYISIFPDAEYSGFWNNDDTLSSNPIVTYEVERTPAPRIDVTGKYKEAHAEADDPENLGTIYTAEDDMDRIYDALKPKRQPIEKKNDSYMMNRIMFMGTFKETIIEASHSRIALCSMCSYLGKRKLKKNAYRLHGFCVDLDDVGAKELNNLMYYCTESRIIPEPSYIVNSGSGLHLYYLFYTPIILKSSVRSWLDHMYRGLEQIVYVAGRTTKKEAKDFQGHLSIYQSFRMVGSFNCKGKSKYRVRAFALRQEPMRWTLTELNGYLDPEYRMPDAVAKKICENDPTDIDYMESHVSKDMAKILYPEWYQRRIVEGRPAGQYICNHKLYDWWIRLIREPGRARNGNRYWICVFVYVFAKKCGISKEIAELDCMNIMQELKQYDTDDNVFTMDDIEAASHFYDNPDAHRISVSYISAMTKIEIPKRKPKQGLTREEAMKVCQTWHDIKCKDGSWRNKDGAPTKRDIVLEWRQEHPEGRKADCIRDTGLTKPTVYKWWDAYRPLPNGQFYL